ncbi:hypothetical protein [Marinibacterium sp. SX1]|uniref:hypothetical protein n=1 Tax=Marinibacterium sp. SX1 TaxID=3388424 RepID=UPI003D1737A8
MTQSTPTLPAYRAGQQLATIVATGLVLAAALISRSALLDLPAIYDELYHLIPAMSWQDNGSYAILDGSYARASVFTRLVALGFDMAGERSATAARFWPSAVPGALLVALIFLWTRVVAGWAAACIAAVFLVLWPTGIEVSQYVRFYALQGLAFAIGALAIHTALGPDLAAWRRAALLALAAAALLLALHLQLITLVGVMAVGLWVALYHGPGWLRRHVWLRWATAAALLAIVLILASGLFGDTLRGLWATYRWQPWPAIPDPTFYHRDFRDTYPTFWPLFPLAALIALRVRPGPASFCLAIFGTCFVLQSFGGLKNVWYLYPAMPFFFVIWAMALAHVGPALFAYLREALRTITAPLGDRPWLTGIVVAGVLAGSAAFVVFANAAFVRATALIAGSDTSTLLGKRRWEWPEAETMTAHWIDDGAVIVTTEALLAVEFLGDYDIAFNRPHFSEMLYSLGPDTRPFTPDIRTGRPIAGQVGDLAPIIACAPVGIVLANAPWITSPDARSIARLAETAGANVSFDSRGGSALLGWRHAPDATLPACPDVPGLAGPSAATRLQSGETGPKRLVTR